MISTREQITTFLDKCDEIKKCKFIMAPTKIKDLLKCIVNSPELYKLFDTVTKNFNYAEQKPACLAVIDDGFFRINRVVLPQTVGQRLAFIFCLLVEFDKGTLNLNEFLQIYYPEDGSYYASYQAFCKSIIVSLEDVIKQVFKEQLESVNEVSQKTEKQPVDHASYRDGLISAISIAIESEKRFILQCSLHEEAKNNGLIMLNELEKAVVKCDEQLIDSLISGYNYFILYNKCVSDGISPLIETIAEFEETL